MRERWINLANALRLDVYDHGHPSGDDPYIRVTFPDFEVDLRQPSIDEALRRSAEIMGLRGGWVLLFEWELT